MKKAFSLAEMMVVMLVLTIVLAASMPIISKRAKMKAGASIASVLPVQTEGKDCSMLSPDNAAVNSDHTVVLTCQSGKWKRAFITLAVKTAGDNCDPLEMNTAIDENYTTILTCQSDHWTKLPSAGGLSCMKVVNSSVGPINLPGDITVLSYTMYGGGGGGGFNYYNSPDSVYNYGGGGGSSAIVYDGSVAASAAGGDGGGYSGIGADGKMSSGTLTNLLAGKSFAVYAGGGGGSRGGGGSGYYGGGGAGKGGTPLYGKGGTGTEGGTGGGTTTPGGTGQKFSGGDSSFKRFSTTINVSGGVGALGAGTNPSGAGYGGTGDTACGYGEAVSYPSTSEANTVFGTGKGGIGGQIILSEPSNYYNGYSHCGYGGSGGSVIIFYTTTASTCFL